MCGVPVVKKGLAEKREVPVCYKKDEYRHACKITLKRPPKKFFYCREGIPPHKEREK